MPPFRWLVIAIVLCAVHAAAASAGSRNQPFPLVKGSYWIYEGTRKSQGRDAQESTEKIRQRMTVLDRTERGGIVAALVRGYPNNDEGTEQVIIAVDGLAYYLLEADPSILKRVRDPNDALVELVQGDDLILSLPLIRGKRFCEASEMTRPDGFYCWRVEEVRKDKLKGVVGVPADVVRSTYSIAFRTSPDHVFVDFVPGVGITAYRYAHHGTTDETELKLVEFHPGAVAAH